LYFKSAYVENFLSFKSNHFVFRDNGLTLIEGDNRDEGGSNGAGKSSFTVEAICWCLFGVTSKGERGDEVVNWVTEKDCVVSISFVHNGDCYSANRYRRHTGLDQKGVPFGNRFCVIRGEELIEKSSVALTQKWFLDELRIDQSLFESTVVFPQGGVFNFVNATDKQQKEILSKIRRIDFQKRLEHTRKEITGLDSQKRELMSKLGILDSHLKTKEELEELKSSADRWESENKSIIKPIKSEMISDINAFKKIKLALDSSRKYPSLDERLDAQTKVVDDIKKEVEAINVSETKLNTLISMKSRDVKNKLELGLKCDECDQEIDQRHITSVIKKKKSQIKTLGDKKELLSLKKKKMVDDLVKQERVETEIQEQINERDELIRTFDTLKTSINKAKVQIERLSEEKNPYLTQYDDIVEKQSKIKIKIRQLRKEDAALEEKEPYLRFWERAYGDKGIKSFVFDSICGSLTSKVNYYINLLTNGSVSVSFDTQSKLKDGSLREKFECIITKNGRDVKYHRYSGGEKTRVALAVDMALSDIMSEFYGSKFNIIIFDEQTNFMDTLGREAFFELAKELSKTKHVFIIDHDLELKSKFEDVITVIKKDGISVI